MKQLVHGKKRKVNPLLFLRRKRKLFLNRNLIYYFLCMFILVCLLQYKCALLYNVNNFLLQDQK